MALKPKRPTVAFISIIAKAFQLCQFHPVTFKTYSFMIDSGIILLSVPMSPKSQVGFLEVFHYDFV
jgi:hypothetical protein